MSRDCTVCCERLNKSTHREIVCVFCEFVACRTCFQKYLSESNSDAHCMSCKKTFNFEFINSNCTNVFITKHFKTHRENILFDREKALLPETQPYVVVEHQRRNIRENITILNEQKYQLMRQVKLLETRINVLYRESSNLTVEQIEQTERRKFVRKCPMEDCRGFLSSQWKCGSCERKICNKCNEEKMEDHTCVPENVASMELLNRDTKPCPNCGTMIFKISGCSQMYCVECHCAWDWNTSRIETGVIHNPHYYEFLQRGGGANRNLADIPCGGLPDIESLRRVFRRNLIEVPIEKVFCGIHQVIAHIEHYELRNYQVEVYNPETYRAIRIRYLMNEIDETEFKTILQQNEKRREKTVSFNNIFQMFVNVGSDILRQIVVFSNENIKKTSECRKFTSENYDILVNLTGYFNENLQKIGKMYKCVYPGISINYMFVSNLETANRRIKLVNLSQPIIE